MLPPRWAAIGNGSTPGPTYGSNALRSAAIRAVRVSSLSADRVSETAAELIIDKITGQGKTSRERLGMLSTVKMPPSSSPESAGLEKESRNLQYSYNEHSVMQADRQL